MKASNPARAVIATALALSCAIGLAGCGGAAPAATVNGTPVAEETVAAYIDDFRATSSLEDDGAWATWLADNGYTPQSVRQEVVDYYVDEELVRQAARERGVSADAAEVDEAVQKAKAVSYTHLDVYKRQGYDAFGFQRVCLSRRGRHGEARRES